MSHDIVARLRERARLARKEDTATALGDARLFDEAAAEIESLRDKLERRTRQAIADMDWLLAEGHIEGPLIPRPYTAQAAQQTAIDARRSKGRR
jgi:hypothetical protein